jgi:hypothetical protein
MSMTQFEVQSSTVASSAPDEFIFEFATFPIAKFKLRFNRIQLDEFVANAIRELHETAIGIKQHKPIPSYSDLEKTIRS